MGITVVFAIGAIIGAVTCLVGLASIESKTHNLENVAKAVGKAVEDATLKTKLKLLLLLGIVEINASIKPSKAENEEVKNSINEAVNSMSAAHTHDIIENVHKTVIGGLIRPSPIDNPRPMVEGKSIDHPMPKVEGKSIDKWPVIEIPDRTSDVIIIGKSEKPKPIETGTIYGGVKEKGDKNQKDKIESRYKNQGNEDKKCESKGVSNPSKSGSISINLPEYDGKTTHGVMVLDDGTQIPLSSGNGDPRYINYRNNGHVEQKAALYMRENNIYDVTVYQNNTNGTCGYCNTMLATFLPEGATLTVVPPKNAVANNSKAIHYVKIFIGSPNDPKISQRYKGN